jgi:hypothetical protein
MRYRVTIFVDGVVEDQWYEKTTEDAYASKYYRASEIERRYPDDPETCKLDESGEPWLPTITSKVERVQETTEACTRCRGHVKTGGDRNEGEGVPCWYCSGKGTITREEVVE